MIALFFVGYFAIGYIGSLLTRILWKIDSRWDESDKNVIMALTFFIWPLMFIVFAFAGAYWFVIWSQNKIVELLKGAIND